MFKRTSGLVPDLSVVIPCFNERENVVLLIDRFFELLPSYNFETEVIFVDGGSTDGTVEVLRHAISQQQYNVVSCLEMPQGGGYGSDIMEGLAEAEAPVLAWTHADLQTDLRDVFEAYEQFQRCAGRKVFIKGSRQNRALLESFFTFGMQLMTYAALKTYLNDINAQPKLFGREFYECFLHADAPDDFSLDLFACYQAKSNSYEIENIPVTFAKRQFGEAKGGGGSWKNKIKLIKRTNSYIWRLSRAICTTTQRYKKGPPN